MNTIMSFYNGLSKIGRLIFARANYNIYCGVCMELKIEPISVIEFMDRLDKKRLDVCYKEGLK